MMRILLVEDDKALADSLAFQLEKEGYPTDTCKDGEEALYYIGQHIHDLVLLDRMLPAISGTEVLRRMRRERNQTPVILITALGELNDRITGLDLGADDYLVKPFDFGELTARIRSIARRPRQMAFGEALAVGDITCRVEENILSGPGGQCSMSRRESALLEIFLRNPGQTLSRTLLLDRVWGIDTDVEEGNLDNYIHFLRRRLKNVGSALCIKTLRGVGYRLEEGTKPC